MMKIFLIMLGLLFYPWKLKLRGDFLLKPEGKKHHILLYGTWKYLFWRKEKQFHQRLEDSELLDLLFRGGKDYEQKDIFPDISFCSFLAYIERFLPRFKVRNFEWNTVLGDGNAAHTALYCGILWSLKGAVMVWLKRWFRFYAPKFEVTPEYRGVYMQIHVACIIHVTFAQIMSITSFYWFAKNHRNTENEKKQ